MNKEKLNWGLVLLFIGGTLLLDNLDIIDFHWRAVFGLWPIILIMIGINLLIPRQGIGGAVSILVTVAILAFLTYRGLNPTFDGWRTVSKGWQDDESERRHRRPDNTSSSHNGYFAHDYDSTITTAHLSIKGGATEYEIDGTTDRLFEAKADRLMVPHHLTVYVDSTAARLSFHTEDRGKKSYRLDSDDNKADIRLNPNPIWHIQLEMGAGTADFDLRRYKIASLRFKGGAAAYEVKLGMPLKETIIEAESGLAAVEIEVPQNAHCRINVEGGLSARDFPGFTKQEDGSYVTPGYDGTSNRFIINLKGGLSAFTVKQY